MRSLKQGSTSVCEYAIRFRTLAAESGWNAMALYDVFLKGLAAPIKDLLVPLDLPPVVDTLIALAIQTDIQLVQLRRQTGSSRENTAPIHLELADGTAFTTGAAISTLHGSRGGAHAAGKSSADTGGAKEAAAGGEVFLLRRGWPSCHFMSSQGILVVKR